jgi:hypothetical protein
MGGHQEDRTKEGRKMKEGKKEQTNGNTILLIKKDGQSPEREKQR